MNFKQLKVVSLCGVCLHTLKFRKTMLSFFPPRYMPPLFLEEQEFPHNIHIGIHSLLKVRCVQEIVFLSHSYKVTLRANLR